jgi:hypothetical protein
MKHASPRSLSALSEVLTSLSTFNLLRERSSGVYYIKSKPFLHFHEDPGGLFADVRRGDKWERLPVNDDRQRRLLLQLVADHVATLEMVAPSKEKPLNP